MMVSERIWILQVAPSSLDLDLRSLEEKEIYVDSDFQ